MINKYNIKIKSLILILVMINTILFGFVFVNASMILNKGDSISSNRLILDLNENASYGSGYKWDYRLYNDRSDSYSFRTTNRIGFEQYGYPSASNRAMNGVDFISTNDDQYFNLFSREFSPGMFPDPDSDVSFTAGRLFDQVPIRSDYKLVIQYISGSFTFTGELAGDAKIEFVVPGADILTYSRDLVTFPTADDPIKEIYFTNTVIEYHPFWINSYKPELYAPYRNGDYYGNYKFKVGLVPVNEVVTDLDSIHFITDVYNEVWDVANNSLLETTSYPYGINSVYNSTHNPLDNPLEFITRSVTQDVIEYHELFNGTYTGLTSSYTNKSFYSPDHNTTLIEYTNSRTAGSYPIEDGGITFQDATSSLKLNFMDGLDYFSFKYRKAFTGAGTRSLRIYINGTEYITDTFGSSSGASNTIYTFINDVSYTGNVEVLIENVGAHVTLGDFVWEANDPLSQRNTVFMGYYSQDVLFNGDYNKWGIKQIYNDLVSNNDPYITEVIWTNPEYDAYMFGGFERGDVDFINKQFVSTTNYTLGYQPLLSWRPYYDGANWDYNFKYNQYYTDSVRTFDFHVENVSTPDYTDVLFNITLYDTNDVPLDPPPPPFPIPDPNNPDIPVVPDSIIVNYYIPDYLSDELFAYRSISIKSDGPTYAPFIEPPIPDESSLSDAEYYEFTHYEIYGGIYNGLTFVFDDMDITKYADNDTLNLIAKFQVLRYPTVDINFYATNLNTNNIDLYDAVTVWNNPKIDITAYSLPDPNDWYLYFYTYNDPVKYDGYIDDFWFEIQSGLFKGTKVDLFAGAPLNGYIVDNKVDVILVVKADIDPNIPGGSGGSGGTTPPIIVPPPDYVPPTGVNSILLIIFNLFGLNSPVGFVLALVIISIAVVVITVIYKVHIFFPIVVIGALVILFTYLQLIPTYLTITITLALVFIIIINLKRSD